MKILRLILIILFFFITKIYSGTIKGFVTDSRTGEPIAAANVIVTGTKLGAATDINGYYIINDLSVGKYIIRTSYIAYKTYLDTVEIMHSEDVIELNIILKSPIVEIESFSTPEIEKYHEKFKELNKVKPVMIIHIDSLNFKKNIVTAYFSMKNNTCDSFYIFKNYPCFQVIEPIIYDSTGKLFKRNSTMIDCMGEKTCPDKSDLLLIKPGETIQYPATRLIFFNFKNELQNRYSVKIKYEFERDTINTFYCGNIKVLLKGLRGTYVSSNELNFINK